MNEDQIGGSIGSTLAGLRRPEYTGANRCIPCTVLNLLVAIVLTAVVGALSPTAGVVVAAVSVAAIYLNGYLVPGTPALTDRYLPESVLAWFDKRPTLKPGDDEFDASLTLERFGAIVDDEVRDDFVIDPTFEREWLDRIDRLPSIESDVEALGTLLGVEPSSLDLDRRGNTFVARRNGRSIGEWESRVAFVADIAANLLLVERDEEWTNLSIAHRSQALGVLRLFLERCPRCDGEVVLGEDVIRSCCRSVDVIATTCRDCGVRLFETEYDDGVASELKPDGPTG